MNDENGIEIVVDRSEIYQNEGNYEWSDNRFTNLFVEMGRKADEFLHFLQLIPNCTPLQKYHRKCQPRKNRIDNFIW